MSGSRIIRRGVLCKSRPSCSLSNITTLNSPTASKRLIQWTHSVGGSVEVVEYVAVKHLLHGSVVARISQNVTQVCVAVALHPACELRICVAVRERDCDTVAALSSQRGGFQGHMF